MKRVGRKTCEFRKPHEKRCRRVAQASFAESNGGRRKRFCFRHYLPRLLDRKSRREWNAVKRRVYGKPLPVCLIDSLWVESL